MNTPPSLFSEEQYQVLVVSLETEEGMENPAFEVYNAQDWATAIQRAVGGEARLSLVCKNCRAVYKGKTSPLL